jgi:hypothetical protein
LIGESGGELSVLGKKGIKNSSIIDVLRRIEFSSSAENTGK